MIVLLFIVHVFIAIALIGVVLLQKSEGGALGMGGGGMSGFMTGRSTANLLTRTTAVLAALFFLTSIALVMLSNAGRAPRSLVDEAPSGPVAPLAPSPAAPQVRAAGGAAAIVAGAAECAPRPLIARRSRRIAVSARECRADRSPRPSGRARGGRQSAAGGLESLDA